MDTYVRDGTAFRKAIQIHVHDGTAWRSAQKAYVHDGTQWRQVFQAGVPELSNISDTGNNVSSDYLYIGYRFTTDGLIKRDYSATRGGQASITDAGHWIAPYPIAGIGANWYVKFVQGSGFPSGITYNTLYQLTSDRTIYLMCDGAELDSSFSVTAHICDSGGTSYANCTLAVSGGTSY